MYKHMAFSRLVGFIAVATILGIGASANAMPRTQEKNVKKGVVKAWRLGKSNYCHLKFPPITLRSLFTNKPELADPDVVGRLIDYYGPCDHDPLGEIEVDRQQNVVQRRLYRE